MRRTLLILQVLQQRRLNADVETPTLSIAKRHTREVHLPTVEVPHKSYHTRCQLLAVEVETSRVGYCPIAILVQSYGAVEAQRVESA